jgi:sugar phosphate isomerase/epimerase
MSRRLWRSGVTVSLVPQASGGPFVFWDSLSHACRSAQQLGFDTIEIFAPAADAIVPNELAGMLNDCDLEAAAFGTGAGWLLHRWTLTDPSPIIRGQAIDFVRRMIHRAGEFGAPAIIGSMQGRVGDAASRAQVYDWLGEALGQLQQDAAEHGVCLLYEPLNRYETNVCTTLAQAAELLDRYQLTNVRLLADLFHMNIEEADLGESIRAAGRRIGHVHFVDSNRRAAGWGHLDFASVIDSLEAI